MNKIILFLFSFALFSSCNKENSNDTKEIVPQVNANGHEYVDLALPSGTLWAKCNIGSAVPEGAGNYYAWGETKEKSDYSLSTYKWYGDVEGSFWLGYTKYAINIGDNKWDNLKILQLGDDIAHIEWGGDWMMPTREHFLELLDSENCTYKETQMNGVKGIEVQSKINGNSLFLPVTGYMNGKEMLGDKDKGYYWSSTLVANNLLAHNGFFSYLESASNSTWSDYLEIYGNVVENKAGKRTDGMVVRAICTKIPTIDKDYLSITKIRKINVLENIVNMKAGETKVVLPIVYPYYLENKTLEWKSSDENVVSIRSSNLLTALSEGKATITIKTTDGGNVSKSFDVVVAPGRNILIENFVAQRTTNCWESYSEMGHLQTKYGSRVIPVNIHCNITYQGIAEIDDYPNMGLMTKDGDYYAQNAGISAKLPNSVVNRMSGEQDPRSSVNILEPYVERYVNMPSGVNIKLDTELSTDSKSLTINTTIENDTNVNGWVQLWLIESNITSTQMFAYGSKNNYEFNDVLRFSVNGKGGEYVEIYAGYSMNLCHHVVMKDFWKPNDMSVVAFMYNNEGVLQAVKENIVKANNK